MKRASSLQPWRTLEHKIVSRGREKGHLVCVSACTRVTEAPTGVFSARSHGARS